MSRYENRAETRERLNSPWPADVGAVPADRMRAWRERDTDASRPGPVPYKPAPKSPLNQFETPLDVRAPALMYDVYSDTYRNRADVEAEMRARQEKHAKKLEAEDRWSADLAKALEADRAHHVKRQVEADAKAYLERKAAERTQGPRSHFGDALAVVKVGYHIRRAGWNGKGMHVELVGGGWVDGVESAPYLQMKAADGVRVPWLASQTDLLADDWELAS